MKYYRQGKPCRKKESVQMQRCQFAGHVIGRALCLFCDPALPAFEGRGPIKTSLLDDLPRLDRGKATEDDLHAVGGGVSVAALVFAMRSQTFSAHLQAASKSGEAMPRRCISAYRAGVSRAEKAVIASMRVMVALLFCRADLRRRRSVVWLAVAASPVDGHIIAQTAEAVGKSAALQKSPYGAFLKIFSTQARTLRAHSMKQSLWDCFYSARVIK